jgi:hypothetical protein
MVEERRRRRRRRVRIGCCEFNGGSLGKVSRVKIGDLGWVILSMHNPLLRCGAVEEVEPKGEGALYIS